MAVLKDNTARGTVLACTRRLFTPRVMCASLFTLYIGDDGYSVHNLQGGCGSYGEGGHKDYGAF